MSNNSPIVVIGSTGKTGRRVLERLQARDIPARGASRGSEPRFDWTEPATWPGALEGASAAYVAFVPDLAIPAAAEAVQHFVDCASKAGLQRIVLLSGRGEAGAQRCEQIVLNCGIPAAVVRASWFAQNFTEGQLLPAVLGGVVALPAGNVKEPFVDVDDIADVAVAALTEDGHEGKVYELTGPRLLTFADAAAEIASASGRNVQYAPVTHEVFFEAMREAAGPDAAHLLTELCREVFDGRNESLADGVQQALGRPARDFSDFCRAAAESGVWA